MGTGSFPGVKSGRGVTLTPQPLLVPWSRKGRAIPLLPLWAVRPVQSLSACTSVHFTIFFSPPQVTSMVRLTTPYFPHFYHGNVSQQTSPRNTHDALQRLTHCVTSGFRHEVDENCALPGHYAASSRNSSPTFRYNLSAPTSRVRNLHAKIRPIGCTSVRNCDYSLRDDPA